MKEWLQLAIAAAALAVNVWVAAQNRKPKKPGRHRRKKR